MQSGEAVPSDCATVLALSITAQKCRSDIVKIGDSDLHSSVAFSSAVRGGVRYTALLAIQICRCLHSTMGHGHFSLQTPILEYMHTGPQLSAAHTTMLGHRESPNTSLISPHK